MKLSEAEWKVMRCVWKRFPASARDVLEELAAETGWAYTTVKTIMSRLAEKNVLKVCMRGNTSFYEPMISRQEARRSAVDSLMDRAFDGAFGSLMHFLIADEHLSQKDREALIEMLKEQPPQPGDPS